MCACVCACIRYTSYAKKRYFIRTVENAHESVCALITRANCTFTSCLIACFSFHRESKELVAFEINSLRFSKCSVAIGKIYDKFAETKLNKIKIFCRISMLLSFDRFKRSRFYEKRSSVSFF